MEEQLESLKRQAFMAPTQSEREQDENRLVLIREISADYLATIQSSHGGLARLAADQATGDRSGPF